MLFFNSNNNPLSLTILNIPHQYRPHHFSLISDLGARHMFTETLNDIMAKRLLSREKLSEITGVNVTLIDERLNGTKEPDERQI